MDGIHMADYLDFPDIFSRMPNWSFALAALGIAGIFYIFGSIQFDIIFDTASNFENHTFSFLGFDLSTINTLCFL